MWSFAHCAHFESLKEDLHEVTNFNEAEIESEVATDRHVIGDTCQKISDV